MTINGNTILITGGTSGIGLGFAKKFIEEGNTVIICGRRIERLQQIKEIHPEIIVKKCDVTKETDREELFHFVLENYPLLNILINNAGVQMVGDLTRPVDLDRIHEETETNFIAPIHLSSMFAAHLASHINSAIINISSGLAFVPIAFMPVYCATKAAVHSFTLSLRYQLRNTNVKVFEIAPPAVDTELGHDRRTDKTQSHGGISVDEFIADAFMAIKDDVLEAPIGMAKGLMEKREKAFDMLNK